MSLSRQVANASKWSALSELASKAVTPVVFLVLARLLSPEDFAVVAVAALVISFAQILWDAGMTKALIQRAGDTDEVATVVFWVNLGLALAVYLVLFLAADLIAELFKDPRVTAVVRVQGLQILLMSVSAVHIALYQKDLNFKPLFWIQLTTTLVPGLASIPLALYGASYWSLVIGTLTGSAAQMLLLWRVSPWRPALRFDVGLARSLFRFGAWATGEGLLGWFYNWGDALVVGAILSFADLGLYRTGTIFVTMVFALLLAPILPVLFSAFSRLQHDKHMLSDALVLSTKAITLIAAPIGLGAFVLSEQAATVIFGSKWEGIGVVLGWMGLSYGLAWTIGANASAYRAAGRPDVNVKIMGAGILYYLPVYVFAAAYGLDSFLVARFFLVVITVPIHIYVAQRLLGLSWRRFLAEVQWFVVASAVAAAIVAVASGFAGGAHPLFELLSLSAVGFAVYVLLLYPERRFIKQVFNMAAVGNGQRKS